MLLTPRHLAPPFCVMAFLRPKSFLRVVPVCLLLLTFSCFATARLIVLQSVSKRAFQEKGFIVIICMLSFILVSISYRYSQMSQIYSSCPSLLQESFPLDDGTRFGVVIESSSENRVEDRDAEVDGLLSRVFAPFSWLVHALSQCVSNCSDGKKTSDE